jgi:hypothetical protein
MRFQCSLRFRLLFATAWLLIMGSGGLCARAQAPKPAVRFEVVSLKPSRPNCSLTQFGPDKDGFHLHCMSLMHLVKYAYGLGFFEENHVLGLPEWGNTEILS